MDMKPKTLLSVTHIKNGVYQAELDLENETDAERLGAAIFQLSRKNPFVLEALRMTMKLLSIDPVTALLAEEFAGIEAVRKLSKTQLS